MVGMAAANITADGTEVVAAAGTEGGNTTVAEAAAGTEVVDITAVPAGGAARVSQMVWHGPSSAFKPCPRLLILPL